MCRIGHKDRSLNGQACCAGGPLSGALNLLNPKHNGNCHNVLALYPNREKKAKCTYIVSSSSIPCNTKRLGDTTVFALHDLHYEKSCYFNIIAHTAVIFSKYITHLIVKGLYLVQCNG
jgi:hypothetical protein